MSHVLNDADSSLLMNAIEHQYRLTQELAREMLWEKNRPAVLFKPKVYKDGNQWCAMLGDNLQEGICGFGNSPDEATRAFDTAWATKEQS